MAMRRLSSTVRLGNSRRPSGTSDTPLRLVSYGRALAISAPAKAMLPALQRTVPVIALQRRRLADAVAAQQGNGLALVHDQRQVLQHDAAGIAGADLVHHQQRLGGGMLGAFGGGRRGLA